VAWSDQLFVHAVAWSMNDSTPEKSKSWLKNLSLALVLCMAAYTILRAPVATLIRDTRSKIGEVVITRADSASEGLGDPKPLLVADSTMLILIGAQLCDTCAVQKTGYETFVQWASKQRIAVRGLTPGLSEGEHSGGAGSPVRRFALFNVSQETIKRLRASRFPSAMLIDPQGILRARWIGELPPPLAVLNALAGFSHPVAAVPSSSTTDLSER
jgi:hypothetical protein